MGNESSTLDIHDSRSGELLLTLDANTSGISWVEYSHDGRYLVASYSDNSIRNWDAYSGRLLSTMLGHANEPLVQFSPDGAELYSWAESNLRPLGKLPIRIWDPLVGASQSLEGYGGSSLTFNSGGNLLAGGSFGGWLAAAEPDHFSYNCAVRLWDPGTGKLIHILRGHKNHVTSVDLHPSGSKLISSSEDGTVRLWDLDTGSTICTQPGRYSAVFNPDGSRYATCVEDSIEIRGTDTGATLRKLERPAKRNWSSQLAFSADGKWLAAGGGKGLRIWSADGRVQQADIAGLNVRSMAVAPDAKSIAIGEWDGSIRVLSLPAGEEIRLLEGHDGSVGTLAFWPHGHRLVSSADDGTRIWDTSTGQTVFTMEFKADAVAVSPDGRRLVYSSGRGDLELEPVKMLRTNPVAEGFDSRRAARSLDVKARTLLDSLFTEHLLADEVVTSLFADNTLDNQVRREAIRIARIRGGNQTRLNEEVWAMLCDPESPDAEMQTALHLAEASRELSPGKAIHWRNVGVAKYRLGFDEEAISALTVADSISTYFTLNGGHPLTVAYLFIAAKRAGQLALADSSLARLEDLMVRPFFKDSDDCKRAFNEVLIISQ